MSSIPVTLTIADRLRVLSSRMQTWKASAAATIGCSHAATLAAPAYPRPHKAGSTSVEKDIHGPVGSLNDSFGENTSGRRHLDSSAEMNATGR